VNLNKIKNLRLIIFILIISFCIGGGSAISYQKIKNRLIKEVIKWDLIENSDWSDDFKKVKIASSKDGSFQNAYFLGTIKKSPLLISLHT
jgi:hypothetical protein